MAFDVWRMTPPLWRLTLSDISEPCTHLFRAVMPPGRSDGASPRQAAAPLTPEAQLPYLASMILARTLEAPLLWPATVLCLPTLLGALALLWQRCACLNKPATSEIQASTSAPQPTPCACAHSSIDAQDLTPAVARTAAAVPPSHLKHALQVQGGAAASAREPATT